MSVEIKDVEPADHSSLTESHPLLLICHGKLRQKQFLYSISQKSCYAYPVPAMRNKSVMSSNFGWLLLLDYTLYDCCLLNFRSGEKVDLPKIRFSCSDCIFTSPPNDPGCRILFLDSDHCCVRFCSVGDDKFLKQEMNINDSYLSDLIFFNGKVYGLMSHGHALMEVEFRARSLQFQQVIQSIRNPMRPDTSCTKDYLVESGGELLFVHRTYVGCFRKYDRETTDFKVFRADFGRGEWVKMKSLGDHAIFLSNTKGKSCCASKANIKGSCIYFVEENDRNLYVFDMEYASISATLPCGKIDNDNLGLHWI